MADYTLSRAPLVLQQTFQPLFRDAMVRRLAEHTAAARPFARAVDLGCGVGDWTMAYLALARRVDGVDLSADFLAHARRRAAADPRGDSVRFVQADIGGYDDFAGCGLVCLGACLMYLPDARVEALLARIAAALPRGAGYLYVRASVVTPLRRPFESSAGFYRAPGWYEARFARLGLATLDRAYSAAVVGAHLARGLRPGGLRAAAAALVAGSARLSRTARRENDFANWVLRREGGG
jgi:SAM-dependent methyltransferase